MEPSTNEDAVRSLVRRESLTNFGFNVVINGALAAWLLSGESELTAFGAAAYGPDLLITGFLLSAIVASIVVATTGGKVRKGALVAPPQSPDRWLDAAAGWSLPRIAATVGVAGAAVAALSVAVFAVLTPTLSVTAYAVLKGLWCGLLAVGIVIAGVRIGVRRGAVTGAPTAP